jgi:hypothetical protein
MERFSEFDESMESSTLKVAVGEKKTLQKAIKALSRKQNVSFGTSMRQVKSDNPMNYLQTSEEVPLSLRTIVLRNGAEIGIRTWGNIDFLVNHCDYVLEDWRKS